MSLELEVGWNGGYSSALNELRSFCEDQIEQIEIRNAIYPGSYPAKLRVIQMRLVIAKIDDMLKENR